MMSLVSHVIIQHCPVTISAPSVRTFLCDHAYYAKQLFVQQGGQELIDVKYERLTDFIYVFCRYTEFNQLSNGAASHKESKM